MYTNLNINEFLDSANKSAGEDLLAGMLSVFTCPLNPDVEKFLIAHSKESAKKGQSATYCVINTETDQLVGYFTLAIKPISVPTSNISKSSAKKLARISEYDEITSTHTLSAYLIAQLGKNFSLAPEERISGNELLQQAAEQIMHLRTLAGGIVEFLECEDNPKLLAFYQKNGFMPFNQRMTKGSEPHLLHQLLKFI